MVAGFDAEVTAFEGSLGKRLTALQGNLKAGTISYKQFVQGVQGILNSLHLPPGIPAFETSPDTEAAVNAGPGPAAPAAKASAAASKINAAYHDLTSIEKAIGAKGKSKHALDVDILNIAAGKGSSWAAKAWPDLYTMLGAHGGMKKYGNRASADLTTIINNAPKRALGGPVTAGRTYLVGERGPELYTADRSGRIIPNDKMGRGGDIYMTGTVNIGSRKSAEVMANRLAFRFAHGG